MATYTKLQNGNWGVRADGKLSDGATVTVTKRDGSTKTETVEKVLWSGKDQKTGKTVSLCAITQRAAGSNGASHKPGTCSECGERCNPRYRKCLNCVDGGGNANGGMSYYDRHGNFVLGDDD